MNPQLKNVSNVATHHPALILCPNDVRRVPQSNLDRIAFSNPRYRDIAKLLEELAILQRRRETVLPFWAHEKDTHQRLEGDIKEESLRKRGELHKLLLKDSKYPEKPRLILMSCDVERNACDYEGVEFASTETRIIAEEIAALATLEYKYELCVTRQDGLTQAEVSSWIPQLIEKMMRVRQALTRMLTGIS